MVKENKNQRNMLSVQDTDYYKFGTIIYNTVGSYRIVDVREDQEFKDKYYYVYGIQYPNFLEAEKEEKSDDYGYYRNLADSDLEAYRMFLNLRKDSLNIKKLSELNDKLKDAGAKRVWIHHSKQYNKKTNFDDFDSTTYGEYLIVVDVTGEHNDPFRTPRDIEQVEKFASDNSWPVHSNFDGILCNYCCGCQNFRPRKDKYIDKEYYVSGIQAPNFIQAEDYDSKKDEHNLEELRKINPEGAENYNKYYAIMCVRHWPDLDALTDLNKYLYQAGAKNTWLIPSEKYNEKTKKIEDYNYGEIGTFLIVIDY